MSNLNSQDTETHIKRVKYQRRKNPLSDMLTLNEVGIRASEKAKQRAFSNGLSITIERNGALIEIFPDGTERVKKAASITPAPTLAEVLA